MLTVDLVRTRRRADRLILIPLSDAERACALTLATTLIEIAQAHLGSDRGALNESLRAALTTFHGDVRIAKGLQKLVVDACEIEEEGELDPIALRDELFALAAQSRKEGPFERARVIATIAAQHQKDSAQIEEALFADLPDAHLVRKVELPGPRSLVARYEQAHVQSVFLRAVRVTAKIEDAPPVALRGLFRKLKFLRLLYRIELRPKTGKSPAGYTIEIDGPYSLFDAVTKYGLQLAIAFPELATLGRWSIEAELRWGKERRPLRLVLAGPGSGATDEPVQLPTEVQRLHDQINSEQTGWTATPSSELFDLPGIGICVPDLTLTRQSDGAIAHVEVLGYWSRAAAWKRIELIEAGLSAPLVFALSKNLRVSEEALPDTLPARLYVYANVLSARTILQRAAEVAVVSSLEKRPR